MGSIQYFYTRFVVGGQRGAVADSCMQLLVAALLFEASDPASFWAPWMKVLGVARSEFWD